MSEDVKEPTRSVNRRTDNNQKDEKTNNSPENTTQKTILCNMNPTKK
jgi:hypothetical protein